MKKIISFLLSMFIIFSLIPCTITQAANVNGKTITSQGACVMDFETGEILYEYNGYKRRVPASMTKIMNMYLIYEALANGEITLDTVVPISKNVYNKSRNSVYQSVLPLYYNTTYTVNEMMDIIVVYSASGAAVAMAELIGGTEQAYVDRMNRKAQEMGIDAYYYDSCGIKENQITPIGMATLARNIIRDYPDILTRSSKNSVYFHGNKYKTTNHLLDTYYYKGADGLKTGTTSAAGYCFCGTAVRNGRRMISVTMSSASTGKRFTDTATLLDYGFSIPPKSKENIFFTDMSTYINGYEVPTFAYKGENNTGYAVIVGEDLANYGFDINYDNNSKTLYISYNQDKPFTPIPINYYKNKKDELAYKIIKSDISVILNDGITEHKLSMIHNVNGYMCLSIDELGKIYDFVWEGDTRTSKITVKSKTPDKAILPNGSELTSGSAYIMNYNTGEEMYAYNADEQKAVASIAKMMSVYVILDAIKNGEITLDTKVPISENVYNLSRNPDYKMMVNLEYDTEYTVDEMIDMIIIYSSAACVTAVAELLSGSEKEFVKRMNEKAEEIGINSVFYNGTGVCLNPETDKENLMSAKEIALMTRHMIQNYPDIVERTKCSSVEFHGQTYYNLNKMFTTHYYKGADGFKNGMTNVSGYCMCGTAVLDGQRLITVTLPSDSNEARFTDTAKMFDYGFSSLGIDISDVYNVPADNSEEKENSEIKEHISNVININIDGTYEMKFEKAQPYIKDGTLMVPLREMLEILEKKVEWDSATGKIVVSDDTTSLYLKSGENTFRLETRHAISKEIIDSMEENFTITPENIDGIVFCPLIETLYQFGITCSFDEDTNQYLIIAGVC